MIVLKLYILDFDAWSEDIVEDLRGYLREKLGDRFRLEVVSVLDNPELADRDGIWVTPTLMKESPSPVKRIIGDFSNKEKLSASLKLINMHPGHA